ncbi:hypothetical protein TNCV_782511 [Trichonephila clavipes]|nr:hypothetical protein TNCV_782511 [Trichonephila clavipes]
MLNLSRAETSSRWCGMVVRRGVPAQVSSTSLDHGSKLRGPSPKALVQLNSATLIFTHSLTQTAEMIAPIECRRLKRLVVRHCTVVSVPLRHEGTLNSRRTASPLVWLVEEETPDHRQVSSLEIGVETSQITLSPVWCSKLRQASLIPLP